MNCSTAEFSKMKDEVPDVKKTTPTATPPTEGTAGSQETATEKVNIPHNERKSLVF